MSSTIRCRSALIAPSMIENAANQRREVNDEGDSRVRKRAADACCPPKATAKRFSSTPQLSCERIQQQRAPVARAIFRSSGSFSVR